MGWGVGYVFPSIILIHDIGGIQMGWDVEEMFGHVLSTYFLPEVL